ncbi:hypothetical protein EMIT0P12_10624 [Pseudomonas sp. IT-P12]
MAPAAPQVLQATMGLIADRVCGDHAEGILDALNIRDLLYGASRDELIRDDVIGNARIAPSFLGTLTFIVSTCGS